MQHFVEPVFFGLAGEEGDAHRLRGFDVGRQFRQHGNAAGDMEAADTDRQTGLDEWLRQIDGARKLVRLHADEPDQTAPALTPEHADDLRWLNPPVGFIVCVQADIDACSQHLAATSVLGQGIETGKRIGGNCRTQPLDRIAVVVVMRRLDHHEVEDRRLPINDRIRHT